MHRGLRHEKGTPRASEMKTPDMRAQREKKYKVQGNKPYDPKKHKREAQYAGGKKEKKKTEYDLYLEAQKKKKKKRARKGILEEQGY